MAKMAISAELASLPVLDAQEIVRELSEHWLPKESP